MSQKNIEEENLTVHSLVVSRPNNLPPCGNKECEFFGQTSRVNYAFAGGGNMCRCYHCHVVIAEQNTNSV